MERTVHSAGWDMHADGNNPGIEKGMGMLGRPVVHAVSVFLEDLATRGLSNDVLFVYTGDFGRTPTINSQDGGRDHWPQCFSVLLAGGGIRGGQVYGSSDSHAAFPRDNLVPAPDLIATVYQRLGISSATELPDQLGRPMRLCFGQPVMELAY